jgi:hypothetical protein
VRQLQATKSTQLPSSVSDVSRVETDSKLCVVGEMYGRQTTMPVLHDLPKALRLRGTRQASEVSIAVCRQLHVSPVITDLVPDLTRLTTQTNPRPRRAAGRRTPPTQRLIISVTAPSRRR